MSHNRGTAMYHVNVFDEDAYYDAPGKVWGPDVEAEFRTFSVCNVLRVAARKLEVHGCTKDLMSGVRVMHTQRIEKPKDPIHVGRGLRLTFRQEGARDWFLVDAEVVSVSAAFKGETKIIVHPDVMDLMVKNVMEDFEVMPL